MVERERDLPRRTTALPQRQAGFETAAGQLVLAVGKRQRGSMVKHRRASQLGQVGSASTRTAQSKPSRHQ